MAKLGTIKPRFFIGIDPGVHTGVAVWDSKSRKFVSVETTTILQAIDLVKAHAVTHRYEGVHVVFEDARKRKALPKDSAGKFDTSRLQGAGSVKRDCKIWEEFLSGIPCEYLLTWKAVAPNGKTNALAKNKALASANLGITGNSSDHARCAAFLVWNS